MNKITTILNVAKNRGVSESWGSSQVFTLGDHDFLVITRNEPRFSVLNLCVLHRGHRVASLNVQQAKFIEATFKMALREVLRNQDTGKLQAFPGDDRLYEV